jgi:peptidyl-prolyl cis-trans isomerase C
MKSRPRLITTLALVTALSACGASDDAAAPATPVAAPTGALVDAPAGVTIATVNDEAITQPTLDVFAKGRGLDPIDPVQRKRALDSLVENVLLAQDALRSGLAQRPDVQAELALVRLQQLAGRSLSEFRQTVKLGDAELLAYYEQEKQRSGGVELHLKHILFDDQATALAVATRASQPDADFDAVMAESSAAGAKQARDLGWANLTQLPAELAQAANALADGKVGAQPVQTSFGWHVFKREASRPFAPPPFEQVKDGARKQVMDAAIAEKVKALRDTASITIAGSPQGS